ncbi:alpha-L-rhamnosidase C-terminal domain-containing protein [Pedobacter aquatilis]|uniref:alpha-L-rhamnosidase C-terminal domain-containing protein n=1 Tax=Pedobacter aquatilis TaxID=351343 RepID=UPI00397781C3
MGGGLTWAKGHYLTPNGKIVSSWRLKAKQIILDIEIPKGVEAEVLIPGETSTRKLTTGNYRFKSNLNLQH